MDPPQSLPPMSFQFRPAVPPQQFVPGPSPGPPHHFQPIGRDVPPGPPQQFYPPPMQHFPQQILPPANGFTPSNPGRPGMPLSSSFTFAPSPYGQMQRGFGDNNQYPVLPQMHALNVSSNGHPTLSTESPNSVSSNPADQPSFANIIAPVAANLAPEALSDWREHASPDGRKYYFNRRTRLSSWEKPIELMTTIERADASTSWKEFTSPDGKKYYYNKVTRESKWVIPEDLKLAREQAMNASSKELPCIPIATSSAPESGSSPAVESASNPDTSLEPESSTPTIASADPVSASGEQKDSVVSGSSSSTVVVAASEANADADQISRTPSALATSDIVTEIAGTATNAVSESMNSSINPTEDTLTTPDGVSAHHKEGASNEAIGEKTKDVVPEDKSVDRESLVYADKMEAKTAFMALLEFANVGSDWNWDRAMRVIINDKRYGALKTLGERKQVFNEFLGQKKKQDAEERRSRQKRAREDFKRMLEESTEVTISTKWSKAEILFENDERFKAVERERERREIYENHIEEVKKEEHAKAQEEHRRNKSDYRRYLESCDFIKANSQWRKVQDRLEADERCSRLEKIIRLEVFQDYINDLEREEEEQRKIQKEELRKVERKNRDDFRKLMDEHVASGDLTFKTHWRDYCMKVKEFPAYLAVVSNASGSTPKDLYDDVVEELGKKFHDDKTRIKDAVKLGKISMTLAWTFDEFKDVIVKEIGAPTVSDVNLKMVFDELLERIREKEEKEAKRRKRLKDDFSHLLCSTKEISASSDWEDCKSILKHRQEYRSVGDESLCQEIFENYVSQLKEQAKERDHKRKDEKARKEKERDESERSKAKHRKEKESGRSREKDDHLERDETVDESADLTESHASKETKRSSHRRHRKRHHSSESHGDETEQSKKSSTEGSGSSHKRNRSHTSATESDHEGRHRRQRRDHRHSSRRNGDHADLEDGEFGNAAEDR